MLFGTEEVVNASPTTLLYHRRRRVQFGDLAISYLEGYQVGAVRTGIFQTNGSTGAEFVAADQQQEVDRSPHIELVFPRNVNGVVVMPQRPSPERGFWRQFETQLGALVGL